MLLCFSRPFLVCSFAWVSFVLRAFFRFLTLRAEAIVADLFFSREDFFGEHLLLGFLLFCGLFSLLFGPGCWASCCSFFSVGFFGCSFALVSFVLRAFFVTFCPDWASCCSLFSRRAFLGALLLGFLLFCRESYFLALGAERRAALFSRRAFLSALLLGFLLFCGLFS